MAEDNPNRIQIEIVLDDGSIQKGFANIQKSGKETAEGLNKSFSLGGLAALAIGLQVANKAYDIFVGSLKDGIKEALNGEQATLRLGTSLKSIAGVTDDSVKAFREFTSVLSSKVAIDDDVINSNASVLASLGRLSGEGLEKATKAAIDLSTGLNISLETAFRRVALAAEGNVAGLQRIGFQFTKGASDAQILSEALGQINSRFGGLAENRAANTFGGIINNLKVAFEDANQALGELVTKSPAVREILKFIAEGFRSSTEAIKQFGSAGGLDSLIIKLVNFGQSINTYLVGPLEVFFNLGKVGFEIVDVLIKNIISSVATLGSGLATVLNAVGISNSFTDKLHEFADAAQQVAFDSINNFQSLRTVLETPLSDGLSSSLDSLSSKLANLKPVAEDLSKGVTASADTMVKELSKAAQQINKSFQEGILKTISVSAQALGASLIKGGSAFSDFRNLVLNIIGDMAIQIGTTLVGIGIGIDQLKLALGTLTGGVAIAAGLALIAVGGLIKSLGAGGISATGPADAGGGFGVSSGGGGFGFTPDEISSATEERKPKEGLVVNVNGDILGDENSGKRLVDLMNAAFDANGVSLRQGLV